MANTYAHTLLNSYLPKDLQISGPVTKKVLKKALIQFAKQDPVGYTKAVPRIKELGDEWATYEGISVGLDDIEPDYEARNKILDAADKKLRSGITGKERLMTYLNAQADVRKIAEKHKGDMGMMARSGGRGNLNQLMKSVASPVVVGDFDGKPVDYLIKRSYAEGLSPAEYWVAGDESRGQVIKGQLGTAEPGDMSKILSNIVSKQVISSEDCGTDNGIRIPVSDTQARGRYLSRTQAAGTRNTLVTQQLINNLDKNSYIFVRSPLTCEASNGVCSHCQGIMNTGKRMQVGENAGLLGAQAMSEPLTQMALSSKHGIALVEKQTEIPGGLKGLRQLLDVPKSFIGKATVAEEHGVVTKINQAPQGGHYVSVNRTEHYLPPSVEPIISEGQKVEAGDALSSGLPNPSEIVQYKGLGSGRNYLINKIRDVYKDSGVDIDARHVENLVVNGLGHVKVNAAPADTGLLPGDIVEHTRLKKILRDKATKIPTNMSTGKILGDNYLHHTAGTPITDSMSREFHESGIDKIRVLPDSEKFEIEPFMVASTRSPLLNPNWLGKLGHRYLKATILQAAHRGETAETSGYDPYSAYVAGKRFGRGTDGRY